MLVFSIQCKNIIQSSRKQNIRNNNPIKISNWFKRPIVIRNGINQKGVETMKNENKEILKTEVPIFLSLSTIFGFSSSSSVEKTTQMV